MDRPYLVNFSGIVSDGKISIRANITDSDDETKLLKKPDATSTPIQSISLFSKEMYRIKIIGLNQENQNIFQREYDTDNYGKLELQLSHSINEHLISKINLYETSFYPGIDIYLGSFLPVQIKTPKKIIISDFDKTLVDTKYSTPKEMYYSLNKPLNYFPSVNPSIEILKDYIQNDFQPFILSASPHFYETAIRNWLYQNHIFASDIYLKDYRDFISIFDGRLSTKDLKKQGFYKLNQLVDILLMIGIPKELVLMGDGFESDPFIYLILNSLLKEKVDPWKLWKSIKNHRIFTLNTKQDSFFLTKFYQLSEMSKNKSDFEVKIYIRATDKNIDELKNKKFNNKYIKDKASEINFYTA